MNDLFDRIKAMEEREAQAGSKIMTELLEKCASYSNVIVYGSNVGDIAFSGKTTVSTGVTYLDGRDIIEPKFAKEIRAVIVIPTVDYTLCEIYKHLSSIYVTNGLTIYAFIPTKYILPEFEIWADCVISLKRITNEQGKSDLIAYNTKPVNKEFQPTILSDFLERKVFC
jgi:hypothetical protein